MSYSGYGSLRISSENRSNMASTPLVRVDLFAVELSAPPNARQLIARLLVPIFGEKPLIDIVRNARRHTELKRLKQLNEIIAVDQFDCLCPVAPGLLFRLDCKDSGRDYDS